ncbi:hypothetical protein BLNAU_12035 [Blattamonas nauphoetae]|uniref:Uncharacterized protein n=1 Tax=Blattamonas nauphoetae TaxID=2049346 RepID=A0ABQ9XKT6_9EUKA|nr:hypothetical protein BLNAU_12035 [Blattamonas nauphoetae]
MKMLGTLIWSCLAKVRLSLIKADLISQIVASLSPQSFLLGNTDSIHMNVMKTITRSLWHATLYGLTELGIKDYKKQQAVHETILQQVIVPSEKYIWHLCVNRYSIVDGDQSGELMQFFTRLLRISPSYQPTMDFVVNLPSRSMVATLSFSFFTTLALLVCGRQCVHRSLVGDTLCILLCSHHSVPISPSIYCLSYSLCLSLTTHTLPLPSAFPSPPTPSHSLCLSLTTHTLPLPSAFPSPPTPSHSPLPFPHHPHPPTPLCLSLTTHTLPLPSASPSPPTHSHSPMPSLSSQLV